MPEILPILLTALLGPLLGSLAGVLLPPREGLLSGLLSFAAGTMLTLSFWELLPESLQKCTPIGAASGLLVGALLMSALRLLLPGEPGEASPGKRETALRVLFAIMLHNLPEGLAMATGGESRAMLLIAAAIAVHDIPEGISTAAPLYYATKNRKKAFWLSFSTVLPTLFGFLIGRFFFRSISPFLSGMLTASVAGLMISLSLRELCPQGRGFRGVPLFGGILFVLLLGQLLGG